MFYAIAYGADQPLTVNKHHLRDPGKANWVTCLRTPESSRYSTTRVESEEVTLVAVQWSY